MVLEHPNIDMLFKKWKTGLDMYVCLVEKHHGTTKNEEDIDVDFTRFKYFNTKWDINLNGKFRLLDNMDKMTLGVVTTF